jgi:hypothetical protein
MTASADMSIEKQNCIREAYAKNVATIIQAVGFGAPAKFFNQAHSIIGLPTVSSKAVTHDRMRSIFSD